MPNQSFKNLFWHKFKAQYLSVIYYGVGLFAYTWLLMAMFPSMKSFDVSSYMKQMPEEFSKFFGGAGGLDYSKFENFISMEYLSMFFVLIIAFYFGSSAGSAIAGSVEKKIADFDLSNSISRTNYLSAQAFVAYIFTALLVIFNTATIWLLGKIYDINLNDKGLITFMVSAIFFLWALTGISLFLSSFLKTKLAVTLITAGFALASYIFLSLINIVDKLESYKYLSIYYLYDPQKMLAGGDINWLHISLLASICLFGYLFSLIIFNKRDL